MELKDKENKKRILMLNYEFPPLGGGASPVSYGIAERLSKTGDFDIEVVTMGYKDLPKHEEVNRNFRINRVKCLRSKKEICHPWEQATYLISAWFKCKELLKKNKYDICHCHFIIPTGVLALRLKKKFNLPYIITSHGSDVLGYNARFKLLYPFLVKIWKNILDNANKIISPSNFLKSEILKVYSNFNDKKIEVIPNGFDTNKFKPQEKKKYIFSSGRLLVNKGFQYLIKAVSDNNIGYEVHIAGDGPMMVELRRLAEKSKTKIIFHGWLDNNGKEYKDLLEQSAIYVLASEKENASIALLEAMSAGCAVITTNVSGCPETVGNSGLLINPKDYEDLKLKLDSLINDQNKLIQLQKLAVERVKNTYDWRIVLKEYKNYIEKSIIKSIVFIKKFN
jgi:glycosyltransferase involved in cell wall biosynthesis